MLATELTEEPKFVGEDDLLVVGEGFGEENFDDFHPVAHVEADEQVVEDEEFEIRFVQVDERGGEANRERELGELCLVQKALRAIDDLARDLDAELDHGIRELDVLLSRAV